MSTTTVKDLCVDLEGKYIRLQRLNPEKDYLELYNNSHGTAEKEAIWNYLHFENFISPFKDPETYKQFLIDLNKNAGWIPYVVVDKKSNRKIGQINYLNVVPTHKRAELGGIWYTPEFWGKYANKESSLLLLYFMFENLKYRRAEWKCNSENIASGKAAVKLGFTEEGIFRQHMISQGANRDTRYLSMLDIEWEEKKQILFNMLGYTKEDKDRLLQYKST